MSEQSLELLERIRARLANISKRMTLARLLFGLILIAGTAAGVWMIVVALEAVLRLDTLPRTVLFWTIVAIFGGMAVYLLVIPILRYLGVLPGPGADSIAHQVGSRFPQIGDRLVNLLDLSEGRRSDAPDELIDRAVQMLGRDVDPVPIEQVEDFSRARRAGRFALVPLLACLLFLTAAPGTFMEASRRLLSPGTHFDTPAPFRLRVEPGSVELARGSALDITVSAQGRELPEVLTLSLNNADEEHVEDVRLTVDSTGTFRHRLPNVRRTFRYRAVSGRVATPWYRVEVTEHPMIRNLQVTVNFPGYAGIPPQRLEPNVGDVTGLPGTAVELDLALGGSEVSQAHVLFDDGTAQPLQVDGGRATGEFVLSREGSYQIILENRSGVQNRDPISYAMNLVPDAPPSIVILEPESDAQLNDDLSARIASRLNDDYGFHDLTLFYRLSESRFGDPSDSFSALDLPLQNPRLLDQEILYDWILSRDTDLDPVPGDVIEYYLRVRDNDAYAGYKAAETPVQRLVLPSLAEQYEQIHEEQDEVESAMESALEQAEQVENQFRELRDEVRRKQRGDWEDQRQLEQIREEQQELERRVEQISEQVESMNRSMQQNNLLSPETLEMFQEMQNVIEEINSPELMEALRQLQQAVEQLDLSQMQQAIENFEFNEEQYQQRMERALELFKNIRAQQVLEEAARRAEELARQQERLAEQTARLQEENRREDDSDQPKREPQASERLDEERESADETSPREDAEGKNDGAQPDSTGRENREATRPDSESERSPSGEQPENTGEQESNSGEQESNPGEQNSPPRDQASDDASSSPSEQRESSPSREQLARQQELSSEEMEQLEELLEEARKRVEETRQNAAEQMQQLNESVRRQQIPEQMQRNAEQLRQNQLQDAQSGQQQMQQQLQQLQNQLSQMQSGMQGMQMQVNLAGLRRALSDVLTLSQQQEQLRRTLSSNVSEAPSLREDARRQVELSEGLTTVIDSLQELSSNIPQMSREVQRRSGAALQEMGRATEAMTERSVGQAASHQKSSMMHLNELALLLSEVMNQLMNASSSGQGGGNLQQMIQQMRQMAEEQQQLNQQIQQFLNDVQGNRLSVDMQQRLQQMGAQQRAIQRQLDELRRNPESRGKLLGDLEKIAEQMEATIRELEQRHVDDRMIERQRQILQRLLDAQRSIHQRGEEDRRESNEGRDVIRESPADVPPEEAAEKLRRDLIRALESGYSPDYEELIKRYFELLQQQNTGSE